MLPPRVEQYLVEVDVVEVEWAAEAGTVLTLNYGAAVTVQSAPSILNKFSFGTKLQIVLNGPTSVAQVLFTHQQTQIGVLQLSFEHTKDKEILLPLHSNQSEQVSNAQCRVRIGRVGRRTPVSPKAIKNEDTQDTVTSLKAEINNLRTNALLGQNNQRSSSREKNSRVCSKERTSRALSRSREKRQPHSAQIKNKIRPPSQVKESRERSSGQQKNAQIQNMLKNRTQTMTHLMLSLQAQQSNESARAQLQLVSKSHLVRVLQDRITELTSQNNRLRLQNESLQLQMQKEMFSSQLRESTIRKKEVNDSQREMRGYKMEILRLERASNDWRDRLEELQRDKKRGHEKLQELKKQMDEMVGTNCKLSSSNVKLIKDNLTFRNSLMQKDQIIVDLRRNHDNERISLEEEIQEFNQKYLGEVRKANVLSRQKDDLVQQREASLKKQDQLTLILSEEREYIDQLNGEKQRNLQQIMKTHQLLDCQNKEVEHLLREAEETKALVLKLRLQILNLQQSVHNQSSGNSQKQSTNQTVCQREQSKSQVKHQRYEQLQKCNEERGRQCMVLQQKLQIQENYAMKLNSEIQQLRQENVKLQSELQLARRKLFQSSFYQSEKSKRASLQPQGQAQEEQISDEEYLDELNKIEDKNENEAVMRNTTPIDQSTPAKQRVKKCNSSMTGGSYNRPLIKTKDNHSEHRRSFSKKAKLPFDECYDSYGKDDYAEEDEKSVREEQILNVAMEEFKVKYAQYEAELKMKEERIKVGQKEIYSLNLAYSEAKVRLQVTRQKVQFLEEQLRRMENKNDKLQSKIDLGQAVALRQQISELTRSISQEIDEKHELHLQCMDYETNLRHATEKLQLMQSASRKERVRVDEMREVIQTKQQQLQSYKAQVDSIGDEYKKIIMDRTERVQELQKEIKVQKRELLNMENIVHERDNIRKRYEQCSEDLRSKEEQIHHLNQIINMEREKSQLLEVTLKRTQNQLEDNKERLEDMDEVEMQFQSQLQSNQQQYNQLQECFAEAENKHLSELKQLNDLWQGKYKQATDETERALGIIEEEREYFGSKIAHFQINISDKEKIIWELQNQINGKIGKSIISEKGGKNNNGKKEGEKKMVNCVLGQNRDKQVGERKSGALQELVNAKIHNAKMQNKAQQLQMLSEVRCSTP